MRYYWGMRFSVLFLLGALIGCEGDSTAGPLSPAAPTNLVVTPSPPDRIIVTWVDASLTETGFTVEYSGGGNGGWVPLTVTPANTTSAIHEHPLIGVAYRYRVRACRNTSCSEAVTSSDLRLVLPAELSNPSAEVLTATTVILRAVINPRGEPATVRFEYDTVRILVSDSTTRTSVAQHVSASDTPVVVSIAVNGLRAGREYSFRAVAVNAGGTWHGATRTFITAPDYVPIQVRAVAMTGTSISVMWQHTAGPHYEYRVERAVGSGPFEELMRLPIFWAPGSIAAITDDNTPPPHDYHYRVRSCNAGGCSPYSEIATATTRGFPRPDFRWRGWDTQATTAFVYGDLSTNGWPTTVWFELRDEKTGAMITTTNAQDVGSGTAPIPLAHTFSGLTPSTQYRLILYARNPNGIWTFISTFFTKSGP